ncbi:hypothetical protein AGMMS50239_01270 [Bacteroidia bacterium]|nr:hypothetical protein AGMMS50239_01270 [Bacteroidia bacterium]
MNPIKSTAEILALKVFNRDIDKIWIDWAVNMLVAGFDTENLRILAGESEPINQFYAQDLAEKVLSELNLDYSDQEKIIKEYVLFLIEKSLNGEIDNFKTLEILKDICIELDYLNCLYDFYLLYYAKEDLRYSEFQYYWEKNNLDRENIDDFITLYFRNYLNGIETVVDFKQPAIVRVPFWKT